MTPNQKEIMCVLTSENVMRLTREHMKLRATAILGETATEAEIDETMEIFTEARGIKRMFDQVNKDCALTGESVVGFEDTEYYAQQILNIYEFDEAKCLEVAELMREVE